MQYKHAKQELCILAAANAGIVSALSGYDIGTPLVVNKLNTCLFHIVSAIQAWPGASDSKSNKWAINRLKAWQKGLGDLNDNNSISCLAQVTTQSVVDIEERLLDYSVSNNAQVEEIAAKLRLLKPIFDNIVVVNEFFDDRGRNFEGMERADKILSALYKEIDFRW